jgi:major membrane immunogen (membrane-anchored lipoprotein)
MAISKSAKIQAEIEKVTAKIAEQQARLKELEQKKLEAENSEIVEIVRGMSVSLTDLPVLLQTIKSGGVLGQNVPKSADKEDSE